MPVLDAHVHCGLTLPWEVIQERWRGGGIDGGVLFSPAEEIYQRSDPWFTDSEDYRLHREKVHQYLCSLLKDDLFAYWFVWNDFELPWQEFSGIKWHRHADEPVYQYGGEDFYSLLEEICRRRMPVIIEEEMENTIYLLEAINNRTSVIIPHMGMLNGGYRSLKEAGVFENKTVFVDTALGDPTSIRDFASDYGVERIIFGSDFPFGEPAREKHKVEKLFSEGERKKVEEENLRSVLEKVRS